MNKPITRVAVAILTNPTRCSLPNEVMSTSAKRAIQTAIKAPPMSCNSATRLVDHVVISGNDICTSLSCRYKLGVCCIAYIAKHVVAAPSQDAKERMSLAGFEQRKVLDRL